MDKPVRVLQFAASDATLRFVLPLAKALKADGFEVLTAACKSDFGPDMAAHGIPFFDLPVTRGLKPLAILKAVITTACLLRKQSVDIIQAHTYAGGMIGRLAAWLAGTPLVIYTGHGWLYTPETPAWRKQIILLSERVFRLITDYFFLISRQEFETGLKDRILAPDKSVLTLSVGVDCSQFSPGQSRPEVRERLRDALGIPRDAWVCCFVGRIVAEKGLLELAKSFAALHKDHREATLLLVGAITSSERDRDCKERLTAQLAAGGCGDAVVFAGHRDDVRDVLSACDAFVLPSHREGMPVALLEAMAMGLPCVATDIWGCREEIVDGQSGYLVPAGQVEPLERRLRDLLADPVSAARMGRAARNRVVELFSLERVLPVQLRAYRRFREMLRGRRGRALRTRRG